MNFVQRLAVFFLAFTLIFGPLSALAQGETLLAGLVAGVLAYLATGLLAFSVVWCVEGDFSAAKQLFGDRR